MNVLVIAPHPDDESIGCGGTVCLHTETRGDRVAVVFLTSGELGLERLARDQAWRIREGEAEEAARVLGISSLAFLRQPDWYMCDHIEAAAAALSPVLERETPDLIYLPHAQEWHPDHRAALPIVRVALRHSQCADAKITTYEIWTPMAAHDHVEDITPVLRRKVRAICCHRSQVAQLRYDRAARGLAMYRGAVAGGCRYAEVFQSADAAAAWPRDVP